MIALALLRSHSRSPFTGTLLPLRTLARMALCTLQAQLTRPMAVWPRRIRILAGPFSRFRAVYSRIILSPAARAIPVERAASSPQLPAPRLTSSLTLNGARCSLMTPLPRLTSKSFSMRTCQTSLTSFMELLVTMAPAQRAECRPVAPVRPRSSPVALPHLRTV